MVDSGSSQCSSLAGRNRGSDGGPPESAAAVPSAAAPPPSAVDLRPLTGIRAAASIGVVLLHCFFYWQLFVSHEVKYQMTRTNPVLK